MKAQELKNLRHGLGLDRLVFARLLGYTGSDRNDVTRIKQYEGGGRSAKQIPLYIARLVWLLVEHKRLTGSLPTFPDWPGYDYDHAPDPAHQKEIPHGFY